MQFGITDYILKLTNRFCYDWILILGNRFCCYCTFWEADSTAIAHQFWETDRFCCQLRTDFGETDKTCCQLHTNFGESRQLLLPIAHCDWSKQILLWSPQQILLLSIATFSTIGSVCILELLSLLDSASSWGQGTHEELDNGSMGVFIVRRRSDVISIQESCHTMP